VFLISTLKKEDLGMKRLLCAAVLGLFLAGCGSAAKDSEFWKHSSMYTSWDHMKYSINPESCGPDTTKKAKEEGWWGVRNNECPGK
jgi:hypothetical protein